MADTSRVDEDELDVEGRCYGEAVVNVVVVEGREEAGTIGDKDKEVQCLEGKSRG